MSNPNTITAWIDWAQQHFADAELYFGHGTDDSISETIYLLAYALNTDFDLSGFEKDTPLSTEQNENIHSLLRSRVEKKIPAAYLVNEAWFCGLPFYVDDTVLIPRSPIAELIESEFQPWIKRQNIHSILEIGTGSGCIALSCAYYLQDVTVDAVDVDEHAISIANKNTQNLELESRVNIIKSDVFSAITTKKYDIIVSNPPYVSVQEYDALPAEYKHEPEIGLKSGDDGLDCVRIILSEAADYLNDDGILIVEVGNSQTNLESAFPDIPFMWLDFEFGGSGVFLLEKVQLNKYFK
ncbi:Ribosomal protein L3 N(5)-glutamine methyltransferase [hydrothermal vent metagenome]|uniref:Ribosomal protein L3 N(5)-glutamine methyltransferase n=1 Tax=hydrothermal vent metagenome TaxID=652676 RepID=A0A3B0ZL32_9ZZZZ